MTNNLSSRSVVKVQAAKEFSPWESSNFPSSKSTIDKLGLPDNWHDTVQLCNFYYTHDGLIRTVIDKQVEMAINDLRFVYPGSEIGTEEYRFFERAFNSFTDFLIQAATEYFLSGLVIPDIVWGPLPKEESGLENNYIVPVDLWVRDPLRVELKRTPLPNRVLPVWKVSDEEVVFIKNKGVWPDGIKDLETYKMMLDQFPEFVKEVQGGSTSFPLHNSHVLRRKPLYRTQYPIPYLSPVIELLTHKRNLRKMDYAIASRVINAILHIRMGDKDFPLTEDSYDLLDDLEREIRRRGSTASTQERIIELFTNHTVEIDWIFPDTDAMLNTDKYDELNKEILYGLGFPKFLITGEKDKSNTGSTSSALLSPLNSMNALRRDFEWFLNQVAKDMAAKNNISTIPLVKFAPLRLIDLTELVQISQVLESKEVISKTSVARLAGFDFESEQLMRKREEDFIKDIFGEVYEQDNNPDEQDQDSGEGGSVGDQPVSEED